MKKIITLILFVLVGLSAAQAKTWPTGYVRVDGFARVDQVVEWCREFHLYLILDMHDCPGGQTRLRTDERAHRPLLRRGHGAPQGQP